MLKLRGSTVGLVSSTRLAWMVWMVGNVSGQSALPATQFSSSALLCSHDCQGSHLVFCSGQYGHQFPFDNDLMAGTRIMWNFMKQHSSTL